MITIYQLFKIIFGLIASAFILYFLIHYTGVYITVQEDVQRVLIIQNFRKAVQDVYFTGNPVNFSDFGRLDFTLYFNGQAEPPVMKSEVGDMVFLTPMFFSPSDDIFIDRNHMDYGWFKFYFVEALPEIYIIFNPLDTGLWQDTDWELMKNITTLFPSTTGRTPKVKFGFCDGNSLSDNWERYDFLDSPSAVLKGPHAATVFSLCNASMSWNQRLVTISQSCSPDFITQGICIQPPDIYGIGYAYINGSDSSCMYKDSLDLVAMIIGGDGMGIYGISIIGESAYEYKNKVWRDRIRLASMITGQKAQLIESELASLGIEELNECRTLYSSLKGILYFNPDSIHNILSQQDYYKSHNTGRSLLERLGEAKSVHQVLVNKGCEYAL
jgi:hypothetical protein